MREPLKQRHASVVTRDELRNYLRPRRTMGEVVSLREQRQAFLLRLAALQTTIQTASYVWQWIRCVAYNRSMSTTYSSKQSAGLTVLMGVLQGSKRVKDVRRACYYL